MPEDKWVFHGFAGGDYCWLWVIWEGLVSEVLWQLSPKTVVMVASRSFKMVTWLQTLQIAAALSFLICQRKGKANHIFIIFSLTKWPKGNTFQVSTWGISTISTISTACSWLSQLAESVEFRGEYHRVRSQEGALIVNGGESWTKETFIILHKPIRTH